MCSCLPGLGGKETDPSVKPRSHAGSALPAILHEQVDLAPTPLRVISPDLESSRASNSYSYTVLIGGAEDEGFDKAEGSKPFLYKDEESVLKCGGTPQFPSAEGTTDPAVELGMMSPDTCAPRRGSESFEPPSLARVTEEEYIYDKLHEGSVISSTSNTLQRVVSEAQTAVRVIVPPSGQGVTTLTPIHAAETPQSPLKGSSLAQQTETDAKSEVVLWPVSEPVSSLTAHMILIVQNIRLDLRIR